MKKQTALLSLLILFTATLNAQYSWQKLSNAPYSGGKQDDIYFVTPDMGWAVNGLGQIHKTTDGGANWTKQVQKTGTYFRCIGFVDSLKGFAGNIGTDYYPGVTDTNPLYKTTDGGITWNVVTTISGPTIKGLCAINVVNKDLLFAGGRVGGPVYLAQSVDGGDTWRSTDMSPFCAMILDLKFFDADTGFVFAATSTNSADANALILYTVNGGKDFTTVYTSSRFREICWKASFPTRKVGYATLLNSDANANNRYIAKTTDGGLTWNDLLLSDQGSAEFGVGFINEQTGWVGGNTNGFETRDGGSTWTSVNLGTYANKIRLLRTDTGFVGYAIGLNVFKLVASTPVGMEETRNPENKVSLYPNPGSGVFSLVFHDPKTKDGHAEVNITDATGRAIYYNKDLELKDGLTTIDLNNDDLPKGIYLFQISWQGIQFAKRILIE